MSIYDKRPLFKRIASKFYRMATKLEFDDYAIELGKDYYSADFTIDTNWVGASPDTFGHAGGTPGNPAHSEGGAIMISRVSQWNPQTEDHDDIPKDSPKWVLVKNELDRKYSKDKEFIDKVEHMANEYAMGYEPDPDAPRD